MYTASYDKEAGTVYRYICAHYHLDVHNSNQKVVENSRAKILQDFKFQTDKQLPANRPDIMVVDKEQKRAVMMDVAIPADGEIKKKGHEKIKKYQELKKELEQ